MSKDLWGDEPFRDGQPELNNGQWKQQETYAPVPENTIRAARAIQKQAVEEEFDLEELTDQVANDEDDEDFTEVLSDARLRLEQGKLYEMIMNHDLFGGVEADPRAAKSVQKQIRNFARERMEIMLGIRQETLPINGTIVSSPFNELEVDVLKKLASAASKGATETEEANQPPEPSPQQPPKRKTLNTIGKNQTRPITQPQPKPMAKKADPIQRQAKPKPRLDLPPEMEPDYEPLDKPISQMSAEELAERDRQATERQKNRMVITPKNQRAAWPSFEEQTMLAQAQVNRAAGGNAGMSALNGSLSRLVMANISKKS